MNGPKAIFSELWSAGITSANRSATEYNPSVWRLVKSPSRNRSRIPALVLISARGNGRGPRTQNASPRPGLESAGRAKWSIAPRPTTARMRLDPSIDRIIPTTPRSTTRTNHRPSTDATTKPTQVVAGVQPRQTLDPDRAGRDDEQVADRSWRRCQGAATDTSGTSREQDRRQDRHGHQEQPRRPRACAIQFQIQIAPRLRRRIVVRPLVVEARDREVEGQGAQRAPGMRR